MTSKLSWIAFVPLSIAAVAIKIIQIFFMGADGLFFGFNDLMLSYLSIACAVLVLLFAVIFCLTDRKIAPVYLIKKNVVCGVLGLFLAVALASEGANRTFVLMRSMSAGFFEIADIVLTLLCAIVFVVLGLNHFVGNGGVKGLAVFYLVPALWGALRLVECFMQFTTVSIAVTDVTILACYIFATLFLFNYAMIIALMKGKSPVKTAFIYGLPAVVVLISYSIHSLISDYIYSSVNFNVFNNLESIELLLLGLYIFAFVIELSANVRRKDEIEYIEDKDEEYKEIDNEEAEIGAIAGSVTNGAQAQSAQYKKESEQLSVSDDVFFEVAQASIENGSGDYDDVDTSDFIYGTVPEDDDFILPVDSDAVNEYDAPMEPSESADMYITKADSTYDEEEDSSNMEYTDSRMDRIDRLILEITEDDVI
ncbi:MAG: hypothetical protein IJD68_07320 [Ruminococcus sp.]|nr:hypothetical protein [Ruminococcus sp.]